MQKGDSGLEDDDKESGLFLAEIAGLLIVLAINGGGGELQKIGLTEGLDDGHGVILIEPFLEDGFHFVEFRVKGLLEFGFRYRGDAWTEFAEAKQDDG